MAAKCAAMEPEDTLWSFCPSIAASYTLLVAFAVTTMAHVAQAIYHKKPYSWVIIASVLIQTCAYIFRVISILNPTSFAAYAAWFILILVAPVFTNAYVYMIMGRMVWNFVADAKILHITAWRLGTIFVLLDVLAFIVQVIGAASASTGAQGDTERALRGIHIYMAGVGVQQCFILLFLAYAVQFHRTILRQAQQEGAKTPRQAKRLIYVLYLVLLLISIRIVFRLIEYSEGLQSNIPDHEAYQYCLDTLPMLLASVILNLVHPGKVMAGKSSDMPGRKERKQQQIRNKSDRENQGSSIQLG